MESSPRSHPVRTFASQYTSKAALPVGVHQVCAALLGRISSSTFSSASDRVTGLADEAIGQAREAKEIDNEGGRDCEELSTSITPTSGWGLVNRGSVSRLAMILYRAQKVTRHDDEAGN